MRGLYESILDDESTILSLLIRFADVSSQIITDIQKLLKKQRYISDDELRAVFPLDNFTNIKFIVWNDGSDEGIVKTPKGWHIK